MVRSWFQANLFVTIIIRYYAKLWSKSKEKISISDHFYIGRVVNELLSNI